MVRMWMVDPRKMCRKHLLGEHVECHMLAGMIKKNISLKGYADKGLIEPVYIWDRHMVLVTEMKLRGYNHNSNLDIDPNIVGALSNNILKSKVDVKKSIKELQKRCKECKF